MTTGTAFRKGFVVTRAFALLVIAALLAACGGGGNTDGNGNGTTPTTPPVITPPTPPPAPPPVVPDPVVPPVATPPSTPEVPPGPAAPVQTLQVLTPTINVQKTTTDRSATATIQLNIANQSSSVFLGGSYSKTGISTARILVGGTTLGIELTFKDPYQLAPGTYNDTVSIRGCLESPCSTHIAGSPITVPVTYTVSAGQATMSLEKTSILIDRFLLSSAPWVPPASDVTFTGTGGIQPQVTVTSTNNAVTSANYSFGRININTRSTTDLGVGSFTDVVTIKACLDSECVNQLAGSPATITLQYVVRSSESGADYRLRGVLARANGLVWDATRQVIYVAMSSSDPGHPDTIGVLDPSSATFLSFTPVGKEPRALEISPDGQYLYVGLRGASEIQRLTLPSLALDLTIPLGTRFDIQGGTPLYALEMHASPDSPNILGVIRGDSSNNALDLPIFDGSVRRPQSLGQSAVADDVTSFNWDTGSRLFGYAGGTASLISVGPGGVQMTASQQLTSSETMGHIGRTVLQNGRVYTQSGFVYDPASFVLIGSFPAPAGFKVMALDAGRTFFMMKDVIHSFDTNTLSAIGSLSLPSTDVSTGSRMIRWGHDGLAVLEQQGFFPDGIAILLIDGQFVRP